jgi:hypothetical protein
MQMSAVGGGEGRGEAEGEGGVVGEEEEVEEKGGEGGGDSEMEKCIYEERKSGIEQGMEVEEEQEKDGERGEEGDAKEEEVQGEEGEEGQEGQDGSREDVEEGDEEGGEGGEEGGQSADRPAAKRFKFFEVLFILTLNRKYTRALSFENLLRRVRGDEETPDDDFVFVDFFVDFFCCEGCVQMRRALMMTCGGTCLLRLICSGVV